jgi:amidohydrolase
MSEIDPRGTPGRAGRGDRPARCPEGECTALRHELHALAETAHQERETSARIRAFLEKYPPDRLITGIGGHGLAALYAGPAAGPRWLLRCELDALPIPEGHDLPYRARSESVSHKCGHDGHMAILAAVAARLSADRPERGSVVLLYQPAEETGEGAARVLADDRVAALAPDRVVALHNLPGFERGSVILRRGCFAAASTGMAIGLHGATAHAAEPERGRSPAQALAQLITQFGAVAQNHVPLQDSIKVTIVHAVLGERTPTGGVAYGTTPGEAGVHATIRAYDEDTLARAVSCCRQIAAGLAAAEGLEHQVSLIEPFPATINDDTVVDAIVRAAAAIGIPVIEPPAPFGWSEDFGHFTHRYPGALFGLGAGRSHAPLHHPAYDFPDEIIGRGADLLERMIRRSS